MRFVVIFIAAVLLGGCQLVYKLPTRQGNIIEQKQLDQLKVGMTHEQVLYLLGTPLSASPFRKDRWDYVGYYRSPRGKVSKRIVTLRFQGDVLAKVEGQEESKVAKGVENPDLKSLAHDAKKDAQDAERAKDRANRPTGIVIVPE